MSKKIKILKLCLLISCLSMASLVYGDNSRDYQVQLITIVKNNEYKLNMLSEQIRYLQDKNSSLELQVNQLKQSLAVEKQNNLQLQNDIASLRQQMSNDKLQMQKSLDSAVDKIASETSKAVNSAIKTTKPSQQYSQTSSETTKNSSSDDYYTYKVQEGATLFTVAKAYKVSVDSIKKANNLKSDMIHTNQVLYIPKK